MRPGGDARVAAADASDGSPGPEPPRAVEASATAPTPARTTRDGSDGGVPRVTFANRFFHPDLSATSQMLSDLAFGLAAEGLEVAVIASRSRYDRPDAALPARERIRGVDVARVATTRFGRATLAGRLLDYLSFYVSAAWRVARAGRPGEILVAKTDPPLLALALQPVARLRGMRVVHWYQDVFPEVVAAAGMRLGPPAVDRLAQAALRRLRDRAARGADAVVAIGARMRARLAPLRPDRTPEVIENWADLDALVPVAPAANALREAWGLADRIVVEYSGNMGFAHPFEAILEAAEALRDEPRVVFLFVGGGVRRAWLEAEAARRGLSRTVRFEPYQARERLAESLGVGDLHLVCLDPAMEGLIVPSKFYGIGAAGRPTLFVGAPDGEIALEIARRGCGEAFAADDGPGLAAAIRDYARDPARRAAEGAAARAAVERANSRRGAVLAWRALLARVAREGSGA